MRYAIIGATVLAGAILAGCSTTDSAEKSDPLDDVRVGKRVDRICFSSGISGFREWNGDEGLIVRRGAREEYLVTFAGVCPPADNALRIGVDERFGGGCLRRGDRLFVSSRMSSGPGGSPFDSDRCLVGAIYEWNKNATDDMTADDMASDAMSEREAEAGDQ